MQPRFLSIDLLRTLAIAGMILFHAAFDLAWFYGWDIDVYRGGWWLLARGTASLFLLLAGMSFAITSLEKHAGAVWRSACRRAGLILGAACMVSIATYAFVGEEYVRFGILHLIGVGALLLALLQPFLQRWRGSGMVLGILCIVIGRAIYGTVVQTSLLLPLGLMPPDFETVDYFPMLPWFGVMLIGVDVGRFFFAHRMPRTPRAEHNASSLLRTLTWPGRHALLVYLAHQPLLFLLLRLFLGPFSQS